MVDLVGWLCRRGTTEVDLDNGQALLAATLAASGPSGLQALVGEFAFVAWDPESRLLIAARDPLASRPLFWSWNGRRLVVASSARCVLDMSERPLDPDEGAIAELLCQRPETATATLWEGIQRVSSGTAIAFDSRLSRVTTVPVWSPTINTAPQDVDEAIRHAVSRAVRRRARPGEIVACELSGGLDSTTIVGVAREAGVDVHPYSNVYPGLACDEQPFIDATVKHFGLNGTLLEDAPPTIEQRRRCIREHGLLGDYVLGDEAPRRAAAADGCNTILSGDFGDEVLGGSRVHAAADELHAFRPQALRRIVLGPHRRQLAATAYRDRLRWIAGARVRTKWQQPQPFWLPPSLAQRVNLSERYAAAEHKPLLGPPAFRWMASLLTGWWTQSRSDLGSVDTAPIAEMRYPLGDLELVELSLNIPQAVKTRPDDVRYLHRRVFADLLPPAVLFRRDKAEFSAVTHTHLAAGPDLLGGTPRVVKHGWVDPYGLARLRAEVFAARPMSAFTPHLWVYATINELELWATEFLR